MDNPGMIIDIFLLGVLLVCAIRAYFDGFFAAVVRLLGSLGSLVAAWFISGKYSEVVFDGFLRDGMVQKSYDYLLQAGQNTDAKSALQSLLGFLPDRWEDTVLQNAQGRLDEILTPSMESAAYLTDNLIKPLAVACLSLVIFLVVFMAVSIICSILTRALKIVNDVPIIGTANRFAGLAVGLVSGCIDIILLSFLISIIIVVTGDGVPLISSRTVAQSKILTLTGIINPFIP